MKELDRLFYGKYRNKDNPPTNGRVSNSLGSMIAYNRTPSLFDSQEITDRDKELRSLRELQTIDSSLCIDRKNKPVYLTPKQTQLLCALTYYLNVEDEDIKNKIAEGIKGNGDRVSRPVSISELSKFINDSKRKRCLDQVKEDLFSLSRVRQIQIIETEQNGRKETYKITAPFIHIEETIEKLNAQEEETPDVFNVTFGRAFFHNLNNRYFYVTPRCFEVWRKQPYQTELFSTLLMFLLSIYWRIIYTANIAEARVKSEIRDENKDSKTQTSKEDYTRRIREAREEALTIPLDYSTIKKKLRRDYDSEKQYKSAFKKDLKTAMEGLIEIGLISAYRERTGKKTQEQIEITFSDHYYQSGVLISESESCKGIDVLS